MTAWALVAALAASAAALFALRRFGSRLPQDRPNARSLHRRPVPRAGGLTIWAGFVAAVLAFQLDVPMPRWLWLGGAFLVALVSFIDDIRGVPIALRLSVHVAAGSAVAAWLAGSSGPATVIIAALAIVWASNLFNFMDGSDGLAAAMAITGFGAYAVAAAIAKADALTYAALAIACVPFFVANRPPASMFMGDVGSVPLGFLAGAFGLAGIVSGAWPGWLPPLVFLPFVADSTVTLILRAAHRERIWEAHRSHYYQKLNTLGAGHRGTLAIYVAAMLACAGLALACVVFSPASGPAALAVAVTATLTGFALIDYHCRKQSARTR